MEEQKKEIEQLDKPCSCRYTYDVNRNVWVLKIFCGKHKWIVREYANQKYQEVQE